MAIPSSTSPNKSLLDPEVKNVDFQKENDIEENNQANSRRTRIMGLVKFSIAPRTQHATITGHNIDHSVDELGLRLEGSDYVKWKADATAHPRNWSATRKSLNLGPVILLDLFTLFFATHSTLPSVADTARLEYRLTKTIALVSFSSMYQFGQAFGGVLFPPYSEAFGRKPVYISASLIYCIACIISGTTTSIAGAIVGRFLAGFVSAVPSIIVSGSIEDMFNMTQRVWIMYVWACATTGGLLLGPIYGSYISVSIGWRWVFYVAAASTGVFTILLVFINESRPSLLLSRRVELLKSRTGISHFRINNPDHTPNLRTFAKVALSRPIRLFFTEPLVAIVSAMSAIGWALIYLFTESLPQIYSAFGLSWSQSSLLFLAIGAGMFIGILPRIYDYRLLQKRTDCRLRLRPEDKLVGFSFAAPSLALGLFWLALSVPPASNLPWYASLVGLIPIGFATSEFVCTLSGYLADSYTIYACSALAAMSFLRAVLGGVFPFIATPMYIALGSNWATVILACTATTFCIAPFLFRAHGTRIRQRSKFAKYSLTVNRASQVFDDNME